MSGLIKGVFVPTVVPYTKDGSIDEAELEHIIHWLIRKGISGLYPNGSMGEFIRLSFEERKKVVEIIARAAGGRVPILAGAAEPNIDMVLDMCRHCADLGCRAVSLTGPYYYKVSQESIEQYFREIAQRSPIDIILYNIPQFANEISLPVLERLALDCPRIVGVKDSSMDMCRMLHTLNAVKGQRPAFSVLVGWEELFVPSLFMGADGGTLSTAGVAPEAIMKMYHAARSGAWAEAKRMQFKLLEVFQAMVSATNFPEGFRAGYEIRGFRVGPARHPLSVDERRCMEEIRGRIACLLAECGFPEAAETCAAVGGGKTSSSKDERDALVRSIVRDVLKNIEPKGQ